MRWFSIIAVYMLIWWLVVFAVIPFSIRTQRDMGEELISGQSHGAPGNFRPLRLVLWTTAISTVLMTLFYLNFVYGWVTPRSVLWMFPLPGFANSSLVHGS